MKKILFFIILIVLCASGFYIYDNYFKEDQLKKFLETIEPTKLDINKYYVYGTHLNFESSLIDEIKSDNLKIILKSKNEEIEYDLNIDNNSFNLSNNINEGINLEELNDEVYYILLKETNGEEIKYYSFNNKTNYEDTTYYSIIKDNKTNKMNINFKDYFKINIDKIKDDNIYDIVIDAGHGGDDSGATNGNHYEANYTYEYSISLKEKLESLGYKVKLTREENDGIKTYGKNSRTAIPNEVHSKLLISIHFNSSEDYITQTGIEVYAPNNANLDFAYKLAKSLKENTSLDYSTNTAYLEKNGVYIKTFRDSDIAYMNEQADQNGYNHYNITYSTPYLYIIRETGGIITKAFVDGRNKKYEANPYYNSNIGVEAYLLELGYINNYKDLKVIMNEKNNYIKTIANEIDKYLKNNS